MKARRHNEEGIDMFREWLLRAKSGGSVAIPIELRDDDEFAELVEPALEPKPIQFKSRYQLALYLDSLIPESQAGEIARDIGFWTWLSLFYFEQLSPLRNDGTRKIGQLVRYIPSISDFRTYYRHLLIGPWLAYRAHGDKPELSKVVLAGPPDQPGELAEQLLSRQEIITNANVLSVAKTLYLDANDRPKSGSGGSRQGSPRRFAAVLAQFDRTYDLFTMPSEELLEFLPREFDRFKVDTV
jgi:hypothetical protein